MKKYSLVGKDISFELNTSATYVTEGDYFTITLKALGPDAKSGLKVPYRIGAIDGELPYDSENNAPNPIRRVRVADYTFGQPYGLFVLDDNLQSTKTFLARKDVFNEPQEAFVLGLLHRPEITVTTIVNNLYVAPPIPPDIPTTPIPKFFLEALQSEVEEGESASFRLSYENVRVGYKGTYSFLDTKDVIESQDEFIVEDSPLILKVPTALLDVNDTPVRLLRVWLTKFPQVNADVRINVKVPPSIYGRYTPGIYNIVVPAYTSIRITLIGAGGGGGGSVNNRTGNWNVQAYGENGGSTSITYQQYSLTASGGNGGTDGHWHNGSSFSNGQPGTAADNLINNFDTFEIITNTKGNIAQANQSRWGDQVGATAVTTLGDIGYNGRGGNGAIGLGDERWSYGGPGASGGLIICNFANRTNTGITLKLVVGSKGKGWVENNGTVGNNGFDGEDGFAIVSQI